MNSGFSYLVWHPVTVYHPITELYPPVFRVWKYGHDIFFPFFHEFSRSCEVACYPGTLLKHTHETVIILEGSLRLCCSSWSSNIFMSHFLDSALHNCPECMQTNHLQTSSSLRNFPLKINFLLEAIVELLFIIFIFGILSGCLSARPLQNPELNRLVWQGQRSSILLVLAYQQVTSGTTSKTWWLPSLVLASSGIFLVGSPSCIVLQISSKTFKPFVTFTELAYGS